MKFHLRPVTLRKVIIATGVAGLVLGIVILIGVWKWGSFGGTENGTTEEMTFDLGNGVELTLCWCPPGTFVMGSPVTEEDLREDEVQHEVSLTQGFWMAKTETTQAQWEALIGDNPSHFKGKNLPVESVSWDEAQAFAAALTVRLRLEGKLDPGWEFRLPTEAQWEYACRAGTVTAYFTGNREQDMGKAGWYAGNAGEGSSKFKEWLQSLPLIGSWYKGGSASGSEPKHVGGKAENAFGLQDMHGNVWEWCKDWYGPYPEEAVVDPMGPPAGDGRVARGGYWGLTAAGCRSALRGRCKPEYRGDDLGFRVAAVPVLDRGAETSGESQ